jgi:Rha family phage regulatory protein
MNITSAVMNGKSHPVLEFEYSRKGKVNIIKVLDLRKVYRFPRQWIVISDVVTALGTFSNGTTSRAIAAIPREHHFSSRVRFSGTQAGRRIGLVSYIGLLRFIRELSTFPTHNLKVWMRAVMIPELQEYYESRRTMSITPAPTLDKPVKDKLVKARVVENPEGVTAGSEKEAWPDDVSQQETLPCTDLVRIDENQHVIVDSLMIAKQFSRLHKDVLKSIKNLNCTPKFNGRNFAPAEYLDAKGEKRPMVTMTRDGCIFLIAKLKGSEAGIFLERYIAAFNAMEAELRKPQPVTQSYQPTSDINHELVMLLREELQLNRNSQSQSIEVMASAIQAIALAVTKMAEATTRMSESRSPVPSNKFSVLAFAIMHGVTLTKAQAQKLGRLCSCECGKLNLLVESIPDSKHGSVYVYPLNALIRVFRAEYPHIRFGDFKDDDGQSVALNM